MGSAGSQRGGTQCPAAQERGVTVPGLWAACPVSRPQKMRPLLSTHEVAPNVAPLHIAHGPRDRGVSTVRLGARRKS